MVLVHKVAEVIDPIIGKLEESVSSTNDKVEIRTGDHVRVSKGDRESLDLMVPVKTWQRS